MANILDIILRFIVVFTIPIFDGQTQYFVGYMIWRRDSHIWAVFFCFPNVYTGFGIFWALNADWNHPRSVEGLSHRAAPGR